MARHWRCRVRVHRWSPTATLKAAGIASACCAASKANGGVPAGAPESSSSGQEFGRAAITQLAGQRISLERATLGSVSGAGVVLGHEDGWRISGHRGACHGFWPAGVGTAAGTAGTRLAETDGLRYLRIERLQPGDQLLDAPACCPSSAAAPAASLEHRRPACPEPQEGRLKPAGRIVDALKVSLRSAGRGRVEPCPAWPPGVRGPDESGLPSPMTGESLRRGAVAWDS
jgi:hypothetical protein